MPKHGCQAYDLAIRKQSILTLVGAQSDTFSVGANIYWIDSEDVVLSGRVIFGDTISTRKGDRSASRTLLPLLQTIRYSLPSACICQFLCNQLGCAGDLQAVNVLPLADGQLGPVGDGTGVDEVDEVKMVVNVLLYISHLSMYIDIRTLPRSRAGYS